MAKARSPKRWLDIACGLGSSLAVYEPKKNVQVTGVDSSTKNVARMKKAYTKAQFLVADAHHLSFANASFDRVIAAHALEHMQHPGQVLSEIYRILIPQGLLIISVPHANYETVMGQIYPRYHSTSFHQHIFSEHELASQLEKAQFEIVKIQKRRWLYAMVLTGWSLFSRLLGKPLQPEGIMHPQGFGESKGATAKLVSKVSQLPRLLADKLDNVPFISALNFLYPFEIYIVAKKKSKP